MPVLNISVQMDGIAAAVQAKVLLPDGSQIRNIFGWPVKDVTPPAIVVGYPIEIEFDLTFQRGGDRAVYPVFVVCGPTDSKAARDILSGVLAGSASVKQALDGAQSFGDVRVTNAELETVTFGTIDMVCARLEVEVL